MKIRQRLVLWLSPLIILISLANDAAGSCPSMTQGPPCLEYWRAEAVFIGMATRVVHIPLDIHPKRRGQIAGRVLDLNGKPVASVPISLVPADVTLEQIASDPGWIMTSTNRDGRYVFTGLEPGRYLVILNRTESDKTSGPEVLRGLPRMFYPGVNDLSGAIVIVVGKKPEPREYDFHLPIQ